MSSRTPSQPRLGIKAGARAPAPRLPKWGPSPGKSTLCKRVKTHFSALLLVTLLLVSLVTSRSCLLHCLPSLSCRGWTAILQVKTNTCAWGGLVVQHHGQWPQAPGAPAHPVGSWRAVAGSCHRPASAPGSLMSVCRGLWTCLVTLCISFIPELVVIRSSVVTWGLNTSGTA